jgi:hypothetical protein
MVRPRAWQHCGIPVDHSAEGHRAGSRLGINGSPREQFLRLAIVSLGADLARKAYPEIPDGSAVTVQIDPIAIALAVARVLDALGVVTLSVDRLRVPLQASPGRLSTSTSSHETPRFRLYSYMGTISNAVALAALAIAAAGTPQPAQAPRPAVPVEPIAAIFEAFRDHQIVGISDAHGSVQVHTFLLSLIAHPGFPATVDDIVVEFGSARHQAAADRFVNGEDVSAAALRQIWDDTTQAQTWGDPYPEEIMRAVRKVNVSQPAERRVRVVLGDPPILWDQVKTDADHRLWIEMRDAYPAALIQTEVIAKRRRALVVYGQMHLQRKQLHANFEMDAWQAQTVISIIERTSPAKAYTIWIDDPRKLQPDVSSWPAPSLTRLAGTALGATDFTAYRDSPVRFRFRDGKLAQVPREEWRTLRMEEQFDALLWLGPPPAQPTRERTREICADAADLRERIRRLTLGGPPREANQLKQHCASDSGEPPARN